VRRRSLGGALALLLAALARLEPGAARGGGLRCYNFGSPPVLSHASGGGGEAVLQARPGPTHCPVHPGRLRRGPALRLPQGV